MRTTLTAVCVVVVSLLAAVVVRSRFASEPDDAPAKIATDPAAADPIAAQLERVGREYQQLAAARDEAIPNDNNQPTDVTFSDEQWLQERRAAKANAPDPDTLLPQFLAFAQAHSSSPLAFDALFFVVRASGFSEFRDEGKPSPLMAQALDVAWADHKDDPRMVHLLERLAIPSWQSESFLKRALETAPNRAVRAAAGYHLARYYLTLAGCHERSQRIKNESTLTNDERMWKLVVAPNLQKYLPLNGEENSEKIEGLLAQVVADYSDVPVTEWKVSGSGRIFIETAPLAPPKTYSDRAASLLYELKNLVPGKPAPEIVGTDPDGKFFRLSDYRGQVVLLTFSADWCPGCVLLYPLERRLQEKFRGQPFVILSVSCDEKVDTLKSSIALGEITWRCWWDGKEGPIRSAWNDAGLPRLFLLDDQRIIQDANLTAISTVEEFEQAIEPLLEKTAARARASL